QDAVFNSRHDGAVLLGLGPLRVPFGVGLERVPFFLAVGERFPLEEVVEGLVRIADAGSPEAGLLDTVSLPNAEGDRIEPLQQVGQTAGHGVIDAQFVEHGISPYFTDEKVVGCRIVLVIDATISPFFSVSARPATHSGSAWKPAKRFARSSSD